MAEWLWRWTCNLEAVRCRLFESYRGHDFFFGNLHLFCVPRSWTGSVQMKSSMAFIRGNRCIERESRKKKIILRTYYRTGLYYRFWPYYQIFEVSIEHCNGCGKPTEDAYSSGHLVLSHFGTCICSNVETILSWTCHIYGPFEFRISLGTSILL